MVSDIALVMALCVPVLVLGFAVGVTFATGPLGILAFLVLSGLWGLAFTGFPYAIALRTGNPAAVNSSFLLFFDRAGDADGSPTTTPSSTDRCAPRRWPGASG